MPLKDLENVNKFELKNNPLGTGIDIEESNYSEGADSEAMSNF